MIARDALRDISTVLVGLLVVGGPLGADEAPPSGIEPGARRLLEEVAAAYRALPAYADQGRFTQSGTVNGQPQGGTTPVALRFARPNRIDLETGVVRLVSDGQTMTSFVEPLRAYEEMPAPEAITLGTFSNLSSGALLFGGPTGTPLATLVELLVGDDAPKALLERAASLKAEDDREVEGRPARALLIERTDGMDVRLLIDPETKLVRRIELAFRGLDARRPPGATLGEVTLAWDSGPIVTEPPGPDAFAPRPPPEYRKITALADRAGAVEAPRAGQAGAPAPDFSLRVLDGEGKTKVITRAELAGKVVVLDFWATWCGPCLRELPDIQALINTYTEAKREKDLFIVALSQDDDPADPVAIRKKVEATLAKLDIDPAASPLAAVALDPQHEVGKAFEVRGYPTLVLIDAKGVIQAAHLGVTDRATLADEIDTLLRGESLVKPRPEPAAAGPR